MRRLRVANRPAAAAVAKDDPEMMTYVLVALGGAVGSMVRYGLGGLSVAIWGDSFPWGTILINVTGSFLIGLVAAATMPGGVLPAGPAVRILIMVGFCGGYTTFSSFSLQTLDLLRDGRIGAALLNAGLSLAFCVAAAAAGSAAAPLLGRRAAAAEPPGHVTLAVLQRPDRAAEQLSAAAALGAAGRGGRSRIEALVIRRVPRDASMPTEETAGSQALQSVERQRLARLRAIAEGWVGRDGETISRFLEQEGEIGGLLQRAGSGRLIVLARAEGRWRDDAGAPEQERRALHAALFEAERPVLLLPPRAGLGFGKVIAVAWRGDEAVSRAVRSALPLLRRAVRIVLLCDADLREVPEIFRDHALAVELKRLDGANPDEKDVALGESLLHGAGEAQADLLVMGAFMHSMMHERLLGGVTRHMIATAEIAVFLQH